MRRAVRRIHRRIITGKWREGILGGVIIFSLSIIAGMVA